MWVIHSAPAYCRSPGDPVQVREGHGTQKGALRNVSMKQRRHAPPKPDTQQGLNKESLTALGPLQMGLRRASSRRRLNQHVSTQQEEKLIDNTAGLSCVSARANLSTQHKENKSWKAATLVWVQKRAHRSWQVPRSSCPEAEAWPE